MTFLRSPRSPRTYSTTLVISLLGALPAAATAQVGTNFETDAAGTALYVDGGDPLVEHALVNNPLPATQPVSSTGPLGFTATFTPTRTGTSGDAGLTDGDFVGVTVAGGADISLNETPFPAGGTNFYMIEDTDGLLVSCMDEVQLRKLRQNQVDGLDGGVQSLC